MVIGFDELPKGVNPLAKKRSPKNMGSLGTQASQKPKNRPSFASGNKLSLNKMASGERSKNSVNQIINKS